MGLQGDINAVYTKALALKRLIDKECVQLILADADVSRLESVAQSLGHELTDLLAELQRLSLGLHALTLGELKHLSVQLDIDPVGASKDELVSALLKRRNKL